MKRNLIFLLTILLMLCACSGGPDGPKPMSFSNIDCRMSNESMATIIQATVEQPVSSRAIVHDMTADKLILGRDTDGNLEVITFDDGNGNKIFLDVVESVPINNFLFCVRFNSFRILGKAPKVTEEKDTTEDGTEVTKTVVETPDVMTTYMMSNGEAFVNAKNGKMFWLHDMGAHCWMEYGVNIFTYIADRNYSGIMNAVADEENVYIEYRANGEQDFELRKMNLDRMNGMETLSTPDVIPNPQIFLHNSDVLICRDSVVDKAGKIPIRDIPDLSRDVDEQFCEYHVNGRIPDYPTFEWVRLGEEFWVFSPETLSITSNGIPVDGKHNLVAVRMNLDSNNNITSELADIAVFDPIPEETYEKFGDYHVVNIANISGDTYHVYLARENEHKTRTLLVTLEVNLSNHSAKMIKQYVVESSMPIIEWNSLTNNYESYNTGIVFDDTNTKMYFLRSQNEGDALCLLDLDTGILEKRVFPELTIASDKLVMQNGQILMDLFNSGASIGSYSLDSNDINGELILRSMNTRAIVPLSTIRIL